MWIAGEQQHLCLSDNFFRRLYWFVALVAWFRGMVAYRSVIATSYRGLLQGRWRCVFVLLGHNSPGEMQTKLKYCPHSHVSVVKSNMMNGSYRFFSSSLLLPLEKLYGTAATASHVADRPGRPSYSSNFKDLGTAARYCELARNGGMRLKVFSLVC